MKRAYSTESVEAVIAWYTEMFRGKLSDFEKITFRCMQFFFITFSAPLPLFVSFQLSGQPHISLFCTGPQGIAQMPDWPDEYMPVFARCINVIGEI